MPTLSVPPSDGHPGDGPVDGADPAAETGRATGTDADRDEYSLAFAAWALGLTLGVLAALVIAVWVVGGS